jgi:hypothetical protein
MKLNSKDDVLKVRAHTSKGASFNYSGYDDDSTQPKSAAYAVLASSISSHQHGVSR